MATIKDIANKLGISVSTVSKGLNGASDISEQLRQAVFDTAINVGLSALLCDHGMPGTADHGDLTVAEGDQMFNGVVDAFKAVGADIADIGIFAYVIIEKSRRYRGGLKLLHPCVLQSKSYDESADVVTVITWPPLPNPM